jgi:hypothetical protein
MSVQLTLVIPDQKSGIKRIPVYKSVGIKPYGIHSSITTYNTAVMPMLNADSNTNVGPVRSLPFYMQRCIINLHSFVYITSIPYRTQ